MKRIVHFILIIAAAVLTLLPLATAGAQGTQVTLTLTEAQLNSAYRVVSPRYRSVSNVAVDLQPGQVSLAATITFRNGQALTTVSVWTPTVSNGRITWTLVSLTANGQAVPQNLVSAVSNAARAVVQQTVQQALRTQVSGRYTVTEIVITENDLTITATR